MTAGCRPVWRRGRRRPATGEIEGLTEIGFAVSFGVLVDTFLVRTMLVPALTTMLGRWAWWPGGVPTARTPQAAPAANGAQDTL
jgi:putative drug exporter of the RND superfamily